MRNRIVPIIGLLCAACGSSDSPSEGNRNGASDSGSPSGQNAEETPDSGSSSTQEAEDVGSGPESCSAVVDQYSASCDPDGYTMTDCEDLRALYIGEGCGDAWSKYASCAASNMPDCEEGDFPSCRKNFSELFQCQSAWAARTGCTRLRAKDSSCSEETPYALSCLREPPSEECTMIEEGAHCCP